MVMKKKVLHVIDTAGAGGAETVFSNLAAGLDNAKFNSIGLIKSDGWLKRNLQKEGVVFYERDCKGSFNLKYLWYLVTLIRHEKIDVIHSHLLGSNLYASIAGAITCRPVISTFHGKVDVSDTERLLGLKLFIISAFAKKVVFVSDSLQTYILGLFRFSRKKTEVILNGVIQPKTCDDKQKAKETPIIWTDLNNA